MKKAIYLLIMWLCHLSVYAQTDGFDPVSPPNPPSQEVKDSAT